MHRIMKSNARRVSVFNFGRARVGDEDVQKYADQVTDCAAARGASEQRGDAANAHQFAERGSDSEPYRAEGQTQKQSLSHDSPPIPSYRQRYSYRLLSGAGG